MYECVKKHTHVCTCLCVYVRSRVYLCVRVCVDVDVFLSPSILFYCFLFFRLAFFCVVFNYGSAAVRVCTCACVLFVIFQARERAPSPRVWLKSALAAGKRGKRSGCVAGGVGEWLVERGFGWMLGIVFGRVSA